MQRLNVPARLTRSKRKLDSLGEETKIPSSKRASFSNLTNKSNSQKSLRKRISNTMSKSKPNSQVSPSALQLSTQSGEIVVTQVSSKDLAADTNADMIEMMKCIKMVLEQDFKDVSNRLQLQSVPTQLYNTKKYRDSFSSKTVVQAASNEIQSLAKNYLADDRHTQFVIHVRQNTVGRKVYPGLVAVRGILELILKVTSDEFQKSPMSTQQTLRELHSLFFSILTTFPTWPSRRSYLELLQAPFRFKLFGIHVSSPEQGFLHAMLDLLDELMSHRDSVNTKKRTNDADLLDFYLWDAHNAETSSFANFPRNVKFERILLVLDLLIQLFENDLAVFIIKNSNTLHSSIDNPDTCPLICCILWQKHESVHLINPAIKTIIEIFVKMIGLNYPQKAIKVMARLLNLVSHVLNLQEYPDKLVTYPSYGNNTTNLVHEIQKQVDKLENYDFDLNVRVIANVRSPLIQMLLTKDAIQKITNAVKPISLEVPYELIKTKEFLKYPEKSSIVEKNDEKYPYKELKKEKRGSGEVTQGGYLKLLQIYAGSVNSFYRIHAGFIELQKLKQNDEKKKSDSFDLAKLEESLLEEKVEPRQVDLTFQMPVKIKLSHQTCDFYHREIKQLHLLTRLIKKFHQQFATQFNELMKLAKEMEVESEE